RPRTASAEAGGGEWGLARRVFKRASRTTGDDTLHHAGMKKAEPHAAAPPGEWIKITDALP
ncbi:MAG: hypothetical protein Q8M07_02915, partial [Prosthecobacter sp.]|nr:hypothetical protein [Prosthecobacter sp.]